MSNINELMLEMDVMTIAEGMKKMSKKHNFKGKNNRNYRHGFYGTKIYKVWEGMKCRCYNPNHNSFKDYGLRGIQICDSWKNDPVAFCEWAMENGYKEGLQLDRRNNMEGYSPENSRFVTPLVNANNKRSPKKKSSLPTGVRLHGKKFQAHINLDGKYVSLGSWDTPEEASKQYECIKRIYVASLESK